MSALISTVKSNGLFLLQNLNMYILDSGFCCTFNFKGYSIGEESKWVTVQLHFCSLKKWCSASVQKVYSPCWAQNDSKILCKIKNIFSFLFNHWLNAIYFSNGDIEHDDPDVVQFCPKKVTVEEIKEMKQDIDINKQNVNINKQSIEFSVKGRKKRSLANNNITGKCIQCIM